MRHDLRTCDKRLILSGQHGTETWPLDFATVTMEQQASTRFRALFNNFRTKILPLSSVCANICPTYTAVIRRISHVGNEDGEILSPVSKLARSLSAARNAN
jgi:hypothetical protein